MQVTIETNCGKCIVKEELCPFKNYGWQPAEWFCSQGKAYTERCNYCNQLKKKSVGKGVICDNYYFCSIAEELMNFHKNRKTDVDALTKGAYNVGIEMGFIEGEKSVWM
jgi:hypothetical protein